MFGKMLGGLAKEGMKLAEKELKLDQKAPAKRDGPAGAAPAPAPGAAGPEHDLDDGLNIPVSTCTGNKKSLFVGINYFGSKAELRGCINDVKNIKAFVVEKFKFPTDKDHMLTLTDDQKDPTLQPTRANMIAAFKWLVAGAKSGDSLFFHYSGHGGTQKDTDGDDADGQDETLVPVDYEKAGQIVDDDIHKMLVASLPQGVRLTAVMDCCHSGSVFDLPYSYGIDGNQQVVEVDNRKAAIQAAIAAGMALLKGDSSQALARGFEALTFYSKGNTTTSAPGPGASGGSASTSAKAIAVKKTLADVIQFSGCRDEQTSADATIDKAPCGAMSWALIKAFNEKGLNQGYVELLGAIRANLQGKFQQVPQMSTGHRMNLKELKFIM